MSRYIFFADHTPEGRKTRLVTVYAERTGDKLGEIKWFGRWRQYAFFPEPGTVYNPECMGIISGKIFDLKMERSGAKRERAAK